MLNDPILPSHTFLSRAMSHDCIADCSHWNTLREAGLAVQGPVQPRLWPHAGRSELVPGIGRNLGKLGSDLEGLGLFTGSLVVTSAFARVKVVYETFSDEHERLFFGNALIFFRTDAFSEKDGRVFGKAGTVSGKRRSCSIY